MVICGQQIARIGLSAAPFTRWRPKWVTYRATRVKRATQGSSGADDLLKEADELLAKMAQGHLPKKSQPSEIFMEAMPRPGYQLQCDVNGCTIIPVSQSEASQAPSGSFVGTRGQDAAHSNSKPRDFVLAEGKGWKLGYDRNPEDPNGYSALVASDSWSIALTRAEYDDFVKLLRNLRRSVSTLQICGEWRADNEDATLEMSSKHVWVQGRAPQKRLTALQELWNVGRGSQDGEKAKAKAFSLRFIVMSPNAREVEGNWTAEAVMQVLQHLDEEAGENGNVSQDVIEPVTATA